MYQVTKRDGKITDFHLKKIVAAITKAFEAQEKAIHPDIIDMLALKVTADFEPKIQKNLIRVEDIITDPKTPKSIRNIQMPDFLVDEIKDYLDSLYGIAYDARMFPITKSYLHHEMRRGSAKAGVQKIRIHDLRHSHVSLLIDMGFSAVAIANRVGHESIDITYRYAHLFPTTQHAMADQLNMARC